MTKKNLLSKEKSPYLLQHKDDPVHWHPWGDSAFELAKKEDKPIFVSIGNSTNYWCHVMQADSFKSEEIAQLLNESFISIKVDKDERPDIEQIYMDAVLAMTGSGGWPLTALVTPELKPFFGGSFFSREQLSELLNRVVKLWQDEREELIQSSEQITSALSSAKLPDSIVPLSEEIFDIFDELSRSSFDQENGGFGNAPKFPPSQALRCLLRGYEKSGYKDLLHIAELTLEKMARGGIFDQLAGGFSRFSVDETWTIPHFEKTLYDNALLANTYLEAFLVSKKQLFASVAKETLDFLIRELQDDKGGFRSSLDAGDLGREGEYYIWTESELEALLDDDEFLSVKESFEITAHGNFEDNFNILRLANSTAWSDKKVGVLSAAREKMLSIREHRKRPIRSEMIVSSWNALAISAMVKGYQVLSDETYLEAAYSCLYFIEQNLYSKGTLRRRSVGKDSQFAAYLDDYSFLIQALLDVFETDGNSKWLDWSLKLQETLDEKFWDENYNGYFFADDEDQSRLFRKKEYTDSATPSGNGVSALNLLRLYHLTYNEEFKNRAKQTFAACAHLALNHPTAMCSTLLAAHFKFAEPWELVISKKDGSKFESELKKILFESFLPHKVVSWQGSKAKERAEKSKTDQEQAYLCKNQTCGAPLSDVKLIAKQLGIPTA